MKLIEILLEELKECGWPCGTNYACQDADGEIFFSDTKVFLPEANSIWRRDYSDLGWSNKIIRCKVTAEDWREKFVTKDEFMFAQCQSKNSVTKQSDEQLWDGEGLPHVGCECELFDSDSGWEVVVIKFVGNKTVVVDMLDGDEYSFELSTCQFRPIRTEAERRRDESSAQMLDIFMNSELFKGKECNEEAMRAVYDAIAAGKIPGIKVEG